jgi:threonyl-tRNA synthetase
MIHRAIFGSIERFIGILTEHFAGKFPLWLAPTQVRFLTVTSAADQYAEEVMARFRSAGIRAEADIRNEKIGYKIREARNMRDSYIAVIGEKEARDKTLSVRSGKEGELGEMPADDLLERMQSEIKAKRI